MLIKNKKGDFSVVLLVFLVLLVVLGSLFIFSTRSQKVVTELSGLDIMNSVQLEKNLAQFYVMEAAETSLAESYKEMTLHGQYIKNPTFDLELNVKFGMLSDTLNEDLGTVFNEKFKKNFENYYFNEEYLKNLEDSVMANKFNPSFDGEKLKIDISGLMIKEFSEKINVFYSPEIFAETSLSKIGLDNFSRIYEAKEGCKIQKSAEFIKTCFENRLIGFNVEVVNKNSSKDEPLFFVTLTSKKEFLVDGKLESIKLSFILI